MLGNGWGSGDDLIVRTDLETVGEGAGEGGGVDHVAVMSEAYARPAEPIEAGVGPSVQTAEPHSRRSLRVGARSAPACRPIPSDRVKTMVGA